MGFQGVVQASVLFLLIAECFAQTASRNRITVKSYKTNYRVDSWDDGRDEPYRVTFWKFGLKSVYLFDVEGNLRSLTTRDTTTFTFGEVVGFRMLNVPNDEVVEEVRSDLSSLIACTDCEVTWNTLCEVGLPEVCLWDENPRVDFNADAIDSVRRMCSAFGNACETSAADTCAGQCTAGEILFTRCLGRQIEDAPEKIFSSFTSLQLTWASFVWRSVPEPKNIRQMHPAAFVKHLGCDRGSTFRTLCF